MKKIPSFKKKQCIELDGELKKKWYCLSDHCLHQISWNTSLDFGTARQQADNRCSFFFFRRTTQTKMFGFSSSVVALIDLDIHFWLRIMCSPRKWKQTESIFGPVVLNLPVLQHHVTTFQIMAWSLWPVEGGTACERPWLSSQRATKAVYLSLKPSQAQQWEL